MVGCAGSNVFWNYSGRSNSISKEMVFTKNVKCETTTKAFIFLRGFFLPFVLNIRYIFHKDSRS